jgi:hypothetical protein
LSFFLFKSMINNIPESNKWMNINIDFVYMHLFITRNQCVLNRSSNQDAHYVWSFMTKYLRFLCKFTSWSGETTTGNFSDVFLSWTRILHTWFCLSYFLKTNIKLYCIYQYFMSINSFFNTVSVSRYSRNFNS